jgi:hypothetical protein
MTTSNNYIYLLIEREFIALNKPVYKIGRTRQEHNKRIESYPKGSRLLIQMYCDDCINIESKLLRWFRIKYKSRKDIGAEYFEGDYRLMLADIYDVCFKSLDKCGIKEEDEDVEFIFEEDTSSSEESEGEGEKDFDDKLFLINEMLSKLGLSHPHTLDAIVPIEYIARFEVYYQEVKDKYMNLFECLNTPSPNNNIIDIINKIMKLCGNTQLVKVSNYKYAVKDSLSFDKFIITDNWLNDIQKLRYNQDSLVSSRI